MISEIMMSQREGRMQSAGLNATASLQRLRRKAEALSEEMEELTSPHGLRVVGLDNDDSMVVAVADVLESGRRAKTGT